MRTRLCLIGLLVLVVVLNAQVGSEWSGNIVRLEKQKVVVRKSNNDIKQFSIDESLAKQANLKTDQKVTLFYEPADNQVSTVQPLRLTLSDGKVTHDACYQVVDEHKDVLKMADGHSELNFVDSYKYNIAAYTLAEMLGVEDMMPVYVERKYKNGPGSLSWWLPVKMDEADRVKKKISVPDADAWNNQMYRIRVFDELVYDIDANLTNVLIGEDWKIWRVDFTRAFRLNNNLRDPNNLVRCDRQLLEKLKTLDGNELAVKTKGYLTKGEVKAVMARRDKIVARFGQLVRDKGEAAVMY